jgi:hypothetical protein
MAGGADVDLDIHESGDRLVVRFDPGGPVELVGLTESFAALARIYERHYRTASDDAAPKLFITKLTTGSIIAEIAPYAVTFGIPVYQFMQASTTVANFTKRLSDGVKAFAGIAPPLPAIAPSHEDAADLREFMKPLTGKRGAMLQLKHARFRQTDRERETVAEFSFDELELNRAALNIDAALALPPVLSVPLLPSPADRIHKEVMMFFQQASRSPGKEEGRTSDRAVVPDISDKALPTYFRKGVNDLKQQMVRGDDNPLSRAFIVDVHVQSIDGVPKAYVVTDMHSVIDLDS